MAVTIQIGTYTFDNVTAMVNSINGVDSSAPLILDMLAVGRRPGKKITGAVYDARPFPIQGVIIGSSWDDAQNKMDTLKLACSGTQIAVDVNDGTANRRFYCSLGSGIQAVRVSVAAINFTIPFIVTDPPFGVAATQGGAETSTTALSVTGLSQTTYSAAPVFTGSAPPKVTAKVTITSPGVLTSVELVDRVASRTLNVPGSNGSGGFNANDVLTIDSTEKKVRVNQIDVDFTGQFPDFQPGTGSVDFNFYTSSGQSLNQSQLNANNSYPLIGTTSRICQSFQVTASSPLTRLSLVLANVGTGSNFTVNVQTSTANHPSGTVVTGSTATVTASNLSATPNWYNIDFSPGFSLSVSTTYWLVITPSGSNQTNYSLVYTNYPDSYALGKMSVSVDSGSTFADQTGKDFAFKIFLGTVGETNTALYYGSVTENFSTTTYKDAGNTTANWDTTNHQLILGT